MLNILQSISLRMMKLAMWVDIGKGLLPMLLWHCMYILKMSKGHLKVKFRVILKNCLYLLNRAR